MLKGNKGITLVALVITIIVLLILAGVSISLVVGDNGIATKASKASKETKIGQFYEAVGIALSEMSADYAEARSTNASASSDAYFTEGNLAKSLGNQGYKVKKSGGSDIAASSTTVITTGSSNKYVVGDGKDAIEVTFESKDNGFILSSTRPTALVSY